MCENEKSIVDLINNFVFLKMKCFSYEKNISCMGLFGVVKLIRDRLPIMVGQLHPKMELMIMSSRYCIILVNVNINNA